jgi:tagatose-6-phosphate ketose/aldose isomerase
MTTGTRRGPARGTTDPLRGTVEDWLTAFAPESEVGRLLSPPRQEQQELGYGHTLREMAQQPLTWIETASAMVADGARLDSLLDEVGVHSRTGSVLFTGSGSSVYAGECIALPLQQALCVPVQAVPAGLLLTHPESSLPPAGPYLVVSFARSGNSPESRAVLDSLLERDARGRHLVITCNRNGALATASAGNPRVKAVVLDRKTEDQSLVMTSSFTNMALAGAFLGATRTPEAYEQRVESTARAAAEVLRKHGDVLASAARSGFRSALYLGSGCRGGSAHEAGLKMLEMTAGRVFTLTESFLGLRHGPMSAVHEDTLVVAFLSSDEMVRAYETDLLGELDRKELGAGKLIVGSGIPRSLATRPEDVIVDCGDGLRDADLVVLDVLVGQLLGFFRCRHEGLRPDAPSAGGVINRVVESFAIHRRR